MRWFAEAFPKFDQPALREAANRVMDVFTLKVTGGGEFEIQCPKKSADELLSDGKRSSITAQTDEASSKSSPESKTRFRKSKPKTRSTKRKPH